MIPLPDEMHQAGESRHEATPFEMEEDFLNMVETTMPPVDPNEPPLMGLVERLNGPMDRLDYLVAHGPNAEYYRRWPERLPDASAVILEARRQVGCRGCGRIEYATRTVEGYCPQCWHHLGRKEVA